MVNRDERHHVNPDSFRMNLHCVNYNIDNKRWICQATSHMGVIVPPSYSNQEWICDHYNLRFSHNGSNYILRGTPSTPSLGNDNGHFYLKYGKDKYTQILKNNFDSPPLISVPFISLSTNNDMHEHAESVFNRLIRLVILT
jgi:hypothetical protein